MHKGSSTLRIKPPTLFGLAELSQPTWSLPLMGSVESRYAMPSDAILHEAQQLHNVSDRLDSLADEHPVISEALIAISGNVRHTATLLEVLVVTKMGPPSGPGSANAWLAIFCWNDVMRHWEQILRAVRINIMKKKSSKNRLEIARKIISDVNREMQKPRLTESVRNDRIHQDAPIVKEPSARSARV
jgi:hypothetical protein